MILQVVRLALFDAHFCVENPVSKQSSIVDWLITFFVHQTTFLCGLTTKSTWWNTQPVLRDSLFILLQPASHAINVPRKWPVLFISHVAANRLRNRIWFECDFMVILMGSNGDLMGFHGTVWWFTRPGDVKIAIEHGHYIIVDFPS